MYSTFILTIEFLILLFFYSTLRMRQGIRGDLVLMEPESIRRILGVNSEDAQDASINA